MPDCPFCHLSEDRIIWSSDLVIAIRDGYPVTPGHTLIIPRRHTATWFDATPWEQQAIWQAVDAVKAELDAEFSPDGYNVGFNAGRAAGQTVMHLHVHVIPRHDGDMDDPRGGVRGVIPGNQKYDSDAPPAVVDSDDPFADLMAFIPGEDLPLLPVLRHAMRSASEIDIVAAFVQKSGLDLIGGDLTDALDRGASVRLLTGDYLGITHPHALQRLYTLTTEHVGLSARMVLTGNKQVFHPKAYIFARDEHSVAFVGSSNLSKSALTAGVEWNLRTTQEDAATFGAIRRRFDALFHAHNAAPLTAELVASYQHTVRVPPQPEPADALPVPRPIQSEVLNKLERTRADGHSRGLVVMATGLGKTYLSAFDFKRQGGRRALFVAHREEILRQAAETWALVLPDRSIGFLTGLEKTPDADLLFASVQTLSRVRHLRGFDARHFDYVVIDEFHHAAANSYRKLLTHFDPTFMLGLTATPDRMDGARLLELCDGNLVARVGLVEGVASGNLVPFQYHGIKDSLDFTSIPWRSGRFDSEALTKAAATQARMAQALQEYTRHGPAIRRSLVFCCSRVHADFVAEYLRDNDIPAAAVHSGDTSAPRAESLERLRTGELEAIVAVDIFNEGVDLPDVNTILMLRPTESPIIFLQQLGRGLRPGKTLAKPHLTVIDFIGNHRSFLSKPQALLALIGQDSEPGEALRRLRTGEIELPEGCSVHIETDVFDMLERVAKLSKEDHLLYTYLSLRASLGHRPTARQVFSSGASFHPVKQRYGTWFHFLDTMNDLTEAEAEVLEAQRPWFVDISKTKMSRSYKMVAIEVLDDADALHGDIGVAEFSLRCRERIRQDSVLQIELAEHTTSGGSDDDFVRRWRKMPLGIFHEAKGFSRQWFALNGDRLVSRLAVDPAQRNTFDEMTCELTELRLTEYVVNKRRFATQILPFAAPIEMVVSHSGGKPILRFDRKRRPDIPQGEVSVLVEGKPYSFRFVKIAVNVATEYPGGPNVLPALIRRWHGPTAGQPGTKHRVELVRSDDEWTLRSRALVDEPGQLILLSQVPFYPELAIACGVASPQYEGHDLSQPLAVHAARDLDSKQHFVVRALGDSMNGGSLPIADGDLVLCEWMTVTDPAQVEGKPMLLTGGSGDEVLATIKMPVRVDGRWVLRSSNPTHADQAIDPGVTLRVVARPLEVVQERTGAVLWGLYDRDAIAGLFGQTNNPSWRSGHKDLDAGGLSHSVLMVNLRKPKDTPLEHRYADRFTAPDELQWESQASTAPAGAKGKRILHHVEEGRTIHLFVRYNTKTAEGTGEPFVYCGALTTMRHEGSKPIRVWFRLESPLPDRLWRAWADLP